MEIVEGGESWGESSERSTQPATAEVGFTSSKEANQTTGAATGWKFVASVSSVLSWTPSGVFWQQPCDTGISIWLHWFFIMRQQARSSVFICASGTMQAIAGATHDTSNRTSTPNWRRTCLIKIRLRLHRWRKQSALSVWPNRTGRFEDFPHSFCGFDEPAIRKLTPNLLKSRLSATGRIGTEKRVSLELFPDGGQFGSNTSCPDLSEHPQQCDTSSAIVFRQSVLFAVRDRDHRSSDKRTRRLALQITVTFSAHALQSTRASREFPK